MAWELLPWIPGSMSLGQGCTAVTFLGGFEAKRLSIAAKATWFPRQAGLKSSGMCKLFSCQETEFPLLKRWDCVLGRHSRVLNSEERCSFSNFLRVPWNTNMEGGSCPPSPSFYLGNHWGGPKCSSKYLHSSCPWATFYFALGCPRGFPEWVSRPSQTLLLWKGYGEILIGKLLPIVKEPHIQWIINVSYLKGIYKVSDEGFQFSTVLL